MASSSDLAARAPAPVSTSVALASAWPRRAAIAFNALVYGFVLCPLVFVVWLSFFKDAILTFPPSGYTAHWYVSAWRNHAFADGFLFSVRIALVAAILGVLLGVAAAFGLVRFAFRGAGAVRNLLMLPLLIPGIVAGIAIYLFYLRAENALNIDIVGTFGGLIAAHVCLTLPWTLRLVTAGLTNLDTSIEEAARNLGANAWTTFRRVTLPALRPALIAAFLFSFIVSFENLEVSLPLVGANHMTLPIAVMQYLEFNLDPTIAAVAAVQVLLLGIVMLITDRFVKLSQVV
ncbi:ABC transporter permease [Robbsia sp. Bb-Pol-6]|uniref:ABC transporter permease n=1 Tax=Robbsia betulipollinis TaxID=2981849 RepID=A0ABT3ZPP4_9BURK|nr:ABC transporter permease [Robbsia betulipollinis]MCY0388200.1 ABC transporter permease [Robbsia betulipollinis]